MTLKIITTQVLFQFACANFLVGTGSDSIYHVKEINGQFQVANKFFTSQEAKFIQINYYKTVLYTQGIQSYKITHDGDDVNLQLMNEVNTTGEQTCYLQLDKNDRFLAVANYKTNFAIFGILKDGSVNKHPVQFFPKREGHGQNSERQGASHPYEIYFHPNEVSVYVSDLGLDKIYYYKINFQGVLTAGLETKLPPGTGPRHLIAHPSNPHVMYGTNEIACNIHRYEINQNGSLTLQEAYPFNPTLKLLSGDAGAGIVISIARYLYFSLTGQNLISVFQINENTQLTFIKTYSAEGKAPSYLTLNYYETQLFVMNRDSESLAIFDVDEGELNLKQIVEGIKSPQSMVFL